MTDKTQDFTYIYDEHLVDMSIVKRYIFTVHFNILYLNGLEFLESIFVLIYYLGNFNLEYISFKEIKYYEECAALVEGMGFVLVELKIVPAKEVTKISAMIAPTNPDENVGVNDCAKVHRVLLTRLEALLGTEDTMMELTSPGIEHNLKNAAEFALFKGRQVRVWDKTVTDWVGGKIISADEISVKLEVAENEEKTISFENIAKAKFISK